MRSVPLSLLAGAGAFGLATCLVLLAATWPAAALAVLPAATVLLAALLLFEMPMVAVAAFVAIYALGVDVQFDMLGGGTGGGVGGGPIAQLGVTLVKMVPFAVAAVLLLRYGPQRSHNLPFLAFTFIGIISLVVLPMGRVLDTAEMVRSFVGSTAPFVLAFTQAPRSLWSSLCKGAAIVPLLSAGAALLLWPTGLVNAFDPLNFRFQGMHTAPYLAGFCLTALFAATLEYLRGFRLRWLVTAGAVLVVLFATQGRGPIIVALLFLLAVFMFSGPKVLPLKRKVDLAVGGMVPAVLVLGPAFAYALMRFMGDGGGFNYSGRDVIWPYFVDAIRYRPLFGYGLGAGKMIVDPEDPAIRLIQSNAAHNEYLRLAVDGGIIGCGLIFAAIVAWVWLGTRRIAAADRLVLRAALFGFLLFAAVDNALIANMAVMMFAWFTAAMARARIEQRQATLARRGAR